MKVRRVLVTVGLLLAVSLRAAESQRVEVGPEEPVSSAKGEAVTQSSRPALASDGENFLAVWQDARSGGLDIFAARVTRTGEVLDPKGILISGVPPGSSPGLDPEVAWNGESYLVAWTCGNTTYAPETCLARVDREGRGISSVMRPGIRGSLPSLAWNGSQFLLVTSGPTNSDPRILGTLLDRSGNVLTKDILLTSSFAYGADVASNGSLFFAAWRGPNGMIRGVGVDSAGRIRGPEQGISLPGESGFSSEPKIASDGSEFFVVWQHLSGGSRVRARAIDSQGLPKGGVSDLAEDPAFSYPEPDVTFNGREYVSTYRIGDQVEARRLSSRQVPGATIVITRGPIRQTPGAIASSAGRTLILTVPDRAYYPLAADRIGVIGTFLEQTSDIVSPPLGIDVSKSIPAQTAPTAIWDGTNYVVAWSEAARDGLTGQVRVAPFDHPARDVVRGTLVRATQNDQGFPAASFNGQNTLIVWMERETRSAPPGAGNLPAGVVYGARVAGDGTVLSPGAFRISTDATFGSLAVSWDGANHLVAWQSANSKQIVGTRVGPGGSLADPVPFAISQSVTPFGDREPSIAWNGRSYLVVWSALYVHGCPILCPVFKSRIEGRLVSSSGSSSGDTIVLSPFFGGPPAVASSGQEFLLVYFEAGLRAKRLTNDGISLDGAADMNGFPIPGIGGIAATVAWDGEEYLVGVQTQSRNVYLSRVKRDATVLPATPVSISITEEGAPFIAPRSPVSSAIFYQRFAYESPFGGATRIFGRSIVTDDSRTITRRRGARP